MRDESGALLPGTTVTPEFPPLLGGPITSVTNERGEFRFTQLQPGCNQLSLALSGFQSHIEQDLRVSAGATIELTLTLGVAALEQHITVSGRGPVLDPRQPGVVQSLPVEVVEAIPQNRQGGDVGDIASAEAWTAAIGPTL